MGSGCIDSLWIWNNGRLLGRYLKLSPGEVAAALRRMIDAGDNELALTMALAALRQYGDEPKLHALMVEAADQLRSENQFLNPFKYTVYSGRARGWMSRDATPRPGSLSDSNCTPLFACNPLWLE